MSRGTQEWVHKALGQHKVAGVRGRSDRCHSEHLTAPTARSSQEETQPLITEARNEGNTEGIPIGRTRKKLFAAFVLSPFRAFVMKSVSVLSPFRDSVIGAFS